MDDLGDYVSDDALAIDPLRKLGWEVETISWREKNIDWGKFAAVVIRTPWDYQNDPDNFLMALEQIKNSGTRLENPLEVVRWNLSKTYLREIEEKGVYIVPTVWGNDLVNEISVGNWCEKFEADEIIIKPIISATATHTYRLREFFPELTEIFRMREYMVQPFMRNIVNEGEFSLFYFDGEFSHAILKTPKAKDFRVQEEWGGIITAIKPTEKLLTAGKNALDQIDQNLLYARVDFVRDEANEFALMELELIEPALYFRMNKDSPKRFAEVFTKRMNEL